MPSAIADLESSIETLEKKMAEPGFFDQDHKQVLKVTEQLSAQQNALEQLFERWEELESL